MVRVLFKNQLHKEDAYEITFSRRGKQDRTQYLKKSLLQAQKRFYRQWKKENRSVFTVIPDSPAVCTPLQIVDYFLWALQRFYEKHEDRYLELLWPSFGLVHDLDDTRKARYGNYYTQKKPLTLAALENDIPGI